MKSLNEKYGKTATNGEKVKSMVSMGNANQPVINTSIVDKKYSSMTPPFFMTFEIFNMNVHNCLVESRSWSNVMPYSI